jgi:hypothetical protein
MKAKLPKGTLEKLWSDPMNWRGSFYHCKADPRNVVPKRLKSFGWTINFAHPSAVVGLILSIASAVGVILILRLSGHGAWTLPALVVMVIYSVINGRFQSSPRRYEEA